MTAASDSAGRNPLATADVIVCVGAGGVGKTTSAAAVGVAAAKAGRRAVVLTVDPARRLADALGLNDDQPARGEAASAPDDEAVTDGPVGNDAKRIRGRWGKGGQLWVAMLDPAETFDALIAEHAASTEQAEAVLANRIYQNLTSSLGGTNEYMAAERLRALHLDDRFDLVVIDTPPASHAIDLLDSPGRLTRFVDHRLYRSILAPKKGIFRAVNAATQLAVRMVSKVVGTDLLTDVVDFFAAFEGMDEGFRQRASEVSDLLVADSTAYVLITAARETAIAESAWMAQSLAERSIRLDAVVVNRLTPDVGIDELAAIDPATPALDRNLSEHLEMRAAERALIDSFVATTGTDGAGPTVITIDEQDEPVADLRGVRAVADELVAGWR